MIAQDDLQIGWYICKGRCPPACFWNGKKFLAMQFSMGFWEVNEHWHWDKDPKFGTVKPLMLLEEAIEDLEGMKIIKEEE